MSIMNLVTVDSCRYRFKSMSTQVVLDSNRCLRLLLSNVTDPSGIRWHCYSIGFTPRIMGSGWYSTAVAEIWIFLRSVGYIPLFQSSRRERSYHVENTASRPISEVKQRWVWSVLGWVTAWEHQMLLTFLLRLFGAGDVQTWPSIERWWCSHYRVQIHSI